jgi:hypothetical protein
VISIVAMGLLLSASPEVPERRALWTAIDDLRRTIVMYEGAVATQSRPRPFTWVLRQKRRHLRRLVAITVDLGHGDPPVLWDRREFVAPRKRAAACAQAVGQELRNAAIAETALAVVSAARARALLRRMLRKTRYKHLVAFEGCAG